MCIVLVQNWEEFMSTKSKKESEVIDWIHDFDACKHLQNYFLWLIN